VKHILNRYEPVEDMFALN
jgi:hypothetical protein